MQQKTVRIEVTDEYRSAMFAGYRISVEELDACIDDLAEFIVFIDRNRGRYVSSVDDWLDSGVNDGWYVHLRQSSMDRV